MNTNKTILLLLLFIITNIVSAQEIYLETGKTSSSFDYTDSQGTGLDNLEASTYTFMALGYRTHIFLEKLNVAFAVGHFGYGAVGSDDALEGILAWDANYLEFNAGLDYELLAINQTKLYIKGMVATGFLIQGTQSINNEIIKLKNVDDFSKSMVSFKAGAGLLRPVSNQVSLYVQYLFGKSLNQSSGIDNESLIIKSHNVSFGVLVKLFKPIQS